jgi:hypothetical protein
MADPTTDPLGAQVGPSGFSLIKRGLTARLGGAKGMRRLEISLTVTETKQPGRPKHIARVRRTAFRRGHKAQGEDPRRLYIPRAKIPALAKICGGGANTPPRIHHAPATAPRIIYPGKWVPATPFWPSQVSVADHASREGGPFDVLDPLATGAYYLHMDTGLGKTRAAAAVASRIGGPVLAVVPSERIRTQWVEEFNLVFPELRVGRYANPKKNSKKKPPDSNTHDVVVIIINTARTKPPSFYAEYSLVIFDEAHEMGSPSNVKALWGSEAAPFRLGLSATPLNSANGLDRVVFHYLGTPIKAESIPGFHADATNFRARIREIQFAGDPDYCVTATSEATGAVSAIGTILNIVGDDARTAMVATEVARLYDLHNTASPDELAYLGLGPRPKIDATPKYPEGGMRRHCIIVFSELRAYLDTIYAALLAVLPRTAILAPEINPDDEARMEEPPPADQPLVLRGGASQEENERSNTARVLLTTYGYSRRGVSILALTAMVKATSRRNGGRQIDGRIFRRGGDESIRRIIVDVIDTRTVLKGQSTTRRKEYKSRRWPIHKIAAVFTDYQDLGSIKAPPMSAEKLVWAPAKQDPP